MVVLKFGGTSVGTAAAIDRVVAIIAAERRPRIVVVSALAGMTDELLTLAPAGPTETRRRSLHKLLERHLEAATLVSDRVTREALEAAFHGIAATAMAVLDEAAGTALDAKSCDELVAAGELWSSRLLATLLLEHGVPAEWIDVRQVVKTDTHHGGAAPDLDATRAETARLVAPLVARGRVVVLGGFLGSAPDGRTTTLGRGGSDYSAAVLGAALDASEIQIWTDVDGVLTADPRLLPDARLVSHLTYGEAHDLASFGAKVLHPGTITPAIRQNIPVVVRNSYRPAVAGTLVTRRRTEIDRVAAGLACRTGVTLIETTARRGSDSHAVTTAVFETLKAFDAEAALAERSGDRLVITVNDAPEELERALRDATTGGADLQVHRALSTIVLVGEGLAGRSGAMLDAAAALRGLVVHLTVRPPGGRALAFVVDAASGIAAMRRLHDRFLGLPAPPLSLGANVVRA
jgi:aspartate kinase